MESFWTDDRAGLVNIDTTIESSRAACQERLRLMVGQTHDADHAADHAKDHGADHNTERDKAHADDHDKG